MGQVFQSQNPGTQFSYFQDYVALKWTNIHKKSSILEDKTHEFFHKKQILLFWLIILNILGMRLVKLMNQENFWLWKYI